MVTHFNVTGDQRAVGERYVIANIAVVADVRVRHEKVMITYYRRRAWRRAAMNLRMFANDIVVADS